jgi:hypothetical protein
MIGAKTRYFFPMKNIVYPFLDQWSPRSAYQDIELEVPIVPEMTVDITEGSYCIKNMKARRLGGLPGCPRMLHLGGALDRDSTVQMK